MCTFRHEERGPFPRPGEPYGMDDVVSGSRWRRVVGAGAVVLVGAASLGAGIRGSGPADLQVESRGAAGRAATVPSPATAVTEASSTTTTAILSTTTSSPATPAPTATTATTARRPARPRPTATSTTTSLPTTTTASSVRACPSGEVTYTLAMAMVEI